MTIKEIDVRLGDVLKPRTENSLWHSMTAISIENDRLNVEIEPYDKAFNLNDIDGTFKRIERMLYRRRRRLYEYFNVTAIDCIVYDDWTTVGGITVDGDNVIKGYNRRLDNE